MRGGADVDFTALAVLGLGVAFEAEIGIALDEQLAIHRPVRVVANGATFAQSFVFENKWARLFAVTGGAILVQPRHGQSAGRLEDVSAMRVMTLDAIHAAFNDWVMLRQIEFSMGLQMTLETGRRIFSRVDDEFAASAAGLEVFAAGAVAGFAPGLSGEPRLSNVHSGVRTGGKHPGDVGVAIKAGFIADVSCARDFRRGDDGAR